MNKIYKEKLKEILSAKYPKGGGVYKITCLINNKIYIGSTNCFNKRFSIHLLELKFDCHHNHKIQSDYNTHGKDNFKFERIVPMGKRPNRDRLYDVEQEYIDKLNPEYNIQRIVERTVFVKIKKEATKEVVENKPKGVRRLKEGVKGCDINPKAKKIKRKVKNKQPKPKNPVELLKKCKREWKAKNKSRRQKHLAELNKINELVNARRKELNK